MTYDISTFVHDALKAGKSRDSIQKALKTAGWRNEDIEASLNTFADVDFAIPVPRPKPYLSAKEAFIYLLLFLSLYISAWSFGALLFHFINTWFPDALNPYYGYNDLSGVRMATASLIVTFPLFMWLSVITKKDATNPEQKGSKIRKWLTYITLFIAAGTIIGDLITLLYNLLQGELTVRFILKVITVFLIAGAVFGYYLWNLRKEEKV
jgi:hypothetical protein